jgi:hypothetical protein
MALVACVGSTPASSTVGVFGAPLAGTLHVHVQRERDAQAIAGAPVDVGGAVVTTDGAG